MPTTLGNNTSIAGYGRSTGETGKNGQKIDMAVLQVFPAECGDQGWDWLDCAGMIFAAVCVGRRADRSSRMAVFYRGLYFSWNGPRDCRNGCVNASLKLISLGRNEAYCNHCADGVATCCWESSEC